MVVLYTTVPLEIIFPADVNERKTIYQGNQMVEIEQFDYNKAKIVRLISTDPQDYMEESLQPGTII